MAAEPVLEVKALQTIGRYGMLAGGETVVASVSGGPDSVAMLLFLAGMARGMRLDIRVFHLDHKFRGDESAGDAALVEELAAGLELPFKLAAVDVPALLRERGGSPQDVARAVRLEHLMSHADEVGADRVALGHTADDQVETFLMRVVQGAGLTGLGGMPPVSGPIIRPLIEVWRTEVEEYCGLKGVRPRIDASNLKEDYLRNRVRLSLLPFLEAQFGARVREVIFREVESLAADRRFIAEEVRSAFDRVARAAAGEVRIDIESLEALPGSLQRGVIREAWSSLLPGGTSLSWQHVRDIMEKLVEGSTGARLDLPRSALAEREYGELVLKLAGDESEQAPVVLPVPGTAVLPGAGFVIEADVVGAEEIELCTDPDVEYVRADLAVPLEVRPPRPGDRFHPLGSRGTRKLSDFFIDIKLSRGERSRCPLILSSGEVVWVAGRRLDERFRLRPGEKSAIRLRIRPSEEYDVPGGG